MDIILNNEEVRVLGCLIEKKMATPDYYPLSLKSLVSACNQKVNRAPVVSYSEDGVLRTMKELKSKTLVWQGTTGRVPKYEERFVQEYNLNDDEAAVMCMLMLRGPQTVGELRGRSERLCGFESIEEVNDALEDLSSMDYVVRLPRQPGQKEVRYMHLLCGQPEVSAAQETRAEKSSVTSSSVSSVVEKKRLDFLEERFGMLSSELQKLKQEFAEFRRQFE